MKTISLIALLSLSGIYSLAQISDDTTKFNLGSTTVMIIAEESDTNYVDYDNVKEDDKKEKTYCADDYARWGGFYFGVNGLLTSDNSITLPNSANYLDLDYSKSVHFQLNIAEKRFQLGTPHVGLTTGLGFEFNRYEFKRNVNIGYNSDSIWGRIDTTISYNKNFLKATYLQVPLLIDITTHKDPNKAFQFSFGVIGGYKIGSKMKLKYEVDNNKNKDKSKGHYNVNPFKLSATARLSYKNVTVFANYGLTTVFEKNRGPEVYPFSAGLALTPF
jgi:hypothetical protein